MKFSKKPRTLFSIMIGVLVMILIAIICLGVIATMILNGSLKIGSEVVVIAGVHILATLIGAVICGMVSVKPLPSCAITLGVFELFQISATIFTYNGAFQNVLGYFICDLIGAFAGVLLLQSAKTKKNKWLKRHRPR